MEVLDTTVVNVSLPHIAGNLSATIDESTWALTSYLVANAIVLPLTGLAREPLRPQAPAAAPRWPASPMASFLCGLAPNLPLLILFRVIQGFTGGALQPISQAVLLEAFPPEDRGTAMGFWGLGIVVAPDPRPRAGRLAHRQLQLALGLLHQHPGRRSSRSRMIQLYVFDPPYITRRSDRIDYWGIGLLAVGIGALQLLLDKGQQDDWFESSFIIDARRCSRWSGSWRSSCASCATEHPVVDLRVLKVRTYAIGVFLMTVLGFVLYGSLVLLPLLLQTLLGYPSLQAGIALAPRGMGSFIAMPLVGAMMGRMDARKLLAAGLLVGAVHALLARLAQPQPRLLGHLLAAVHPGARPGPAVRAAHHDHHGPDPAREHGQRHQHLQPDAQHRRQHGHRRGDDAAGAPPPGAHEHPRVARRRLSTRRSARCSSSCAPAFVAQGAGRW